MPFLLFKTDKSDTPETVFAGQVNSIDTAKVSETAKKTTGEKPTHITKHDIGATAVTENFYVDFIEKENFGGKFPL